MLILKRRVDDVVVIDVPGHGTIRVMLVMIKSRHVVWLGIDAPKDVNIYREEIGPDAYQQEAS